MVFVSIFTIDVMQVKQMPEIRYFCQLAKRNRWVFLLSILYINSSFAIDLVFSDQLQKNDIVNAIQTFKDKNGRAITEGELVSILTQDGNKVPFREIKQYVKLMIKQQNPRITRNQLLTIFRAKQDSIRDFHAKWRYTYENKDNDTSDDMARIFTWSDGKVLQETISNSERSSVSHLKRLASYDGEVVRLVDIPIKDTSKHGVNAFISRFVSYENHFVLPDNPLWMAMLLNSKKYTFPKTQNYSFDIINLLQDKNSTVFEQSQNFAGIDCIVVSNGLFRVYLAPDYDYSVVGLEIWIQDQISESGTLLFNGIKLRSQRTLSGMTDYGNGLFLPSKITSKLFSKQDGSVAFHETIDVEIIEVNKERYKKEYFTDVIPEDAMVADGINKLTYLQSERASIGSLLKDVAKSKRVMIFRYISVTLGLIMIAIWCVLKYREYLNKRAST